MSIILCAMSGGVDSTVAAARLVDAGHTVVGFTMLLWGGERQNRSCSTADSHAAAAAAGELGIEHRIVDWTSEFDDTVIGSFVTGTAKGRTPNPCVTCNATFKVDGLFDYADSHGFDLVATGHHARVVRRGDGTVALGRSMDLAKDQSYVLHMVDSQRLARLVLPLGELTKDQVRAEAARRRFSVAGTPDSMDLCFSRADVLDAAGVSGPGRVVDAAGSHLGSVERFTAVTIGQRRGLGEAAAGAGEPQYVTRLDAASSTVTIGPRRDLEVREVQLVSMFAPSGAVPHGAVMVQMSAHGTPVRGVLDPHARTVTFDEPTRRPAPGQMVVCYDPLDDVVVAAGEVA